MKTFKKVWIATACSPLSRGRPREERLGGASLRGHIVPEAIQKNLNFIHDEYKLQKPIPILPF
jgi:hypothetical protein